MLTRTILQLQLSTYTVKVLKVVEMLYSFLFISFQCLNLHSFQLIPQLQLRPPSCQRVLRVKMGSAEKPKLGSQRLVKLGQFLKSLKT